MSIPMGALQTLDLVDRDTQITVISPAGSENETVPVTVTTPGGTSATSSADQFTYLLG